MKKVITFLLIIVFIVSISKISADAISFDIGFDTVTDSIYLVNMDTNAVIYEKNANKKKAPGATTKIMTYIVVSEQVKDLENTKVTIKQDIINMLRGTGSALSGFKDGEKFTVLQLLNCMMIGTGNDASLILADFVGNGNISSFVDMMNDKAKELGCENTHFANATGLYHKENYSTAKDIYTISNYALTLPYFEEIVNTTFKYILSEEDGRYIVTTNYMIDRHRGGEYYYKYASGIKSGSDGENSGYCVVSMASNNGFSYMCVALDAPTTDEKGEFLQNNAMLESTKIYEWAFKELDIRNVINTKNTVCEIPVTLAWNKDSILLFPSKSFSMLLPSYVNSGIEYSVNVPKSVQAPINQGDVIGTLTLKYNNDIITTIDLVASETIDRSDILYYKEIMYKVVKSKVFHIIIFVILLLIVIYIIYAIIKNKQNRKKNKKKVKKYRNL